MKWLITALILIFVYLQYRLWIGDGSYAQLANLKSEIAKQSAENARLYELNRVLAEEVMALKQDEDALEERARNDLGMIKKGETFFMVLNKSPGNL